MMNKDKDIKQKVKEYMEIMGIYVPDDQETDERSGETAAEEKRTDEHS